MNLITFMRYILRKFPILFGVNILLSTLASAMEVIGIFTLIPVADFLIRPDLSSASFITQKAAGFISSVGIPVSLATFVLIFLLVNLLAGAFQLLIRYLLLKTKYLVIREMIIGSFEDFFNARWYFFSSNNQGMLLNTFMKEIGNVATAFWAAALLCATCIQLTFYLVVPFYISWQVTIISLTIALIFVVPFFLLGKFSYRFGQVTTRESNNMAAIIQESFGMSKLIIGFGNQSASIKMLSKNFDKYSKATVKTELLTGITSILYNPIGLCAVFITLFIANRLTVPISEMAALLYSLVKIIPAIGQIGTQKNTVNSCLPSYEQFLNLRNSAKRLKQVMGRKILTGIEEKIVIDNLSFSYPNHKPVLTEVSFSMPKGRMIAIVGKSGSGKTTLVDMIIGLHEPTSGKILIDGVPLPDLDMNSYRKRIGYVPQDSILFNASIRENLLWSKNDADDDDIKKACAIANANEFIEKMPQSYDTVVGDCGVRLSGGQRQRIALARAMLRKPDLLILDEATSSLDTHSERLIQKAIEDIAKRITVIVVAHRLSTIVNSDYIYVLKNGRIIEEGTYLQLAGGETEFHNMIRHQVLEEKK